MTSATATLPWANRAPSARGWVVLGNPNSRRISLFQEALAALGQAPARVVPWLDLLTGGVDLRQILRPGDVFRIESPGRDFEVERALLAAGAAEPDAEAFARLTEEELHALSFDRGEILCPRQWYLGLQQALRRVSHQLRECAVHLMAEPRDIAVMFDKRACHAHLEADGIQVPRTLGGPTSYEELRAGMTERECHRVFVKLAHGSSASGVVAYETDGTRHRAVTSVELVSAEDGVRLYNTRRLRVHRNEAAIATLINALCRHRVHVEEWLPKAGMEGCAFDLRVVVVAGRVKHAVVRLSQSPVTNLHLLNRRGDLPALRARMRPGAWDAAQATCERAMASFPGSLHGGVDLLIAPDFRSHAVLEINAFGDLLPGILYEGYDTYQSEILAVLEQANAPRRGAG